jgi:hypothetical protein
MHNFGDVHDSIAMLRRCFHGILTSNDENPHDAIKEITNEVVDMLQDGLEVWLI